MKGDVKRAHVLFLDPSQMEQFRHALEYGEMLTPAFEDAWDDLREGWYRVVAIDEATRLVTVVRVS